MGIDSEPITEADVEVACQQAKALRTEMPELYRLISRRDDQMEGAYRALLAAIPHPGDLPEIAFPFDGIVVKVLGPAEPDESGNDPCSSWLETDDLDLIPRSLRQRMYNICRAGVYLRGSRLSFLAGRS